ncbi:MAG: hypothetical protein H8E57_09965 [Candidatus Cloacimonetes bacterium]|nr:hypothetical protein [Candidatus Cloacimonadota bacterium]
MDEKLDNLKIEKSIFSVISLEDKENTHDYWSKKTAIERLRHIEILRRINYGNGTTTRLQRVFEYSQG